MPPAQFVGIKPPTGELARTVTFNVSNNVAHEFDPCSGSGREKINVQKFIFDQYHQLKLISQSRPSQLSVLHRQRI